MKPILRSLILSPAVFLSLNLWAQQETLPETLPVDTLKEYSQIQPKFSYSKDNEAAASSVKIDLSRVKFTNELSVLEFLQGRVSGLDINSFGANFGESAQVILRGQKFNIYQSPLIVIDGIPQQSFKRMSNSTYKHGEVIQSLIPVPLEDIQSIEVLKDGISTSLYGAEGVNGVILIETKKGSRQKLSLTYQFNQSFVNSPSYKPMLNGEEYIMYQLEAWHNVKGVFDIPEELAMDRSNPNYYNYSANTDWMDAVTQVGNAANHQLSFTGGNEKNRLYGSVNYHDEKGTVINTGTKRLLNRLNFEHHFTKKLTMALNLSYATSKNEGNSMDILGMAFKKAPNMSIWEYDRTGKKTGEYLTSIHDYQGYFNPVAVSETGNALRTTNDLMTTAHLQYKINDWLQFRETFSYNNLTKITKAKVSYSSLGFDTLNGYVNMHTISDTKYEQLRNEIQAFVKVPFNDERINSLNGTFTWIRWNDNYSNDFKNSMDDRMVKSSGLSYERKKNAVVSAVHYKLYDRYMLTAHMRLESNAMDGDLNKGDKFYGTSLAWRFSEEPMFKNSILNNGMLHAGYSNSEYLPTGSFSSYYLYTFDTSITDPYNSFLPMDGKIEVPSYDAGLELELFGNRLHLSADYYYKKPEVKSYLYDSSSLLKMKTIGWEGAIDYAIVSKKNLSWSLQFNMAHHEQTLEKGLKGLNGKPYILENSGFATYLADGKPMGSIYGFQREGVYASDQDAYARGRDGNVYYVDGEPLKMMYAHLYFYKGGDTKYKDINYDGKINDADLVYLGNSIPDLTGGLGSTVRFRNLSFTCNFHYRTGNEVINQSAMDAEGLYGRSNMSKTMLNRWRVQGQQGPDLMPRASLNNPGNYLPSNRYVESGSFVRLNYLNLGYAFNPVFCQKIHVKDLSVDLSGQRLFTYSNYSGLNPETGINNRWLNIDQSVISAPEVYTLSIRITI